MTMAMTVTRNMTLTMTVTMTLALRIVYQALAGPEKAWQRQLMAALMPIWLAMMAYIIWALMFKLESTATF